MRARVTAAVVMTLVVAACSTVVATVDDGRYGALVPSVEQLAASGSFAVPGGFATLRDGGIDEVGVLIRGDRVTFTLDGEEAVTRVVTERRQVRDREGSGPFRPEREVLHLGDEPLALGPLVVPDPVLWPRGDDRTGVLTLRQWDPEERGPLAQCRIDDEVCLELGDGESRIGDPVGTYEDRNDPALDENPLTAVEVTDGYVVYTLDTGGEVRAERSGETLTTACGLSESYVWKVPDEVGLDLRGAVLVHTRCPLPYGEADTVTIMARADLPVLAPLDEEQGGEWCRPGPRCLWFLDESG